MAGGMHGRGCACQEGMCGRGLHAGEMAIEVSSMHPTGMHSCSNLISQRRLIPLIHFGMHSDIFIG